MKTASRLCVALIALGGLLAIPASAPTTAVAAAPAAARAVTLAHMPAAAEIPPSAAAPVPVAITPAADCATTQKLDVLMLGDSIMDRLGYHGGPQTKLAERLGASCVSGRVWNYAVTGSGAADGRYAVKYMVRALQPDVVLIGWEANDNITTSDFGGNYRSILSEVQRWKAGTKVVPSWMSKPIPPTPQWMIDQAGPKNDQICPIAFSNCPRSWEYAPNVAGVANFDRFIKPATCSCTDGIHPIDPTVVDMWAWVWYEAMRGAYGLKTVPAPPGIV